MNPLDKLDAYVTGELSDAEADAFEEAMFDHADDPVKTTNTKKTTDHADDPAEIGMKKRTTNHHPAASGTRILSMTRTGSVEFNLLNELRVEPRFPCKVVPGSTSSPSPQRKAYHATESCHAVDV